eukprot:247527-Ditylum_brightwellii.AAC.1
MEQYNYYYAYKTGLLAGKYLMAEYWFNMVVTEAPKYEPKNQKHAKSPITYSGQTGIQGTLAIWAHKRHHYTAKTSTYTNAM